MTTEIEGYKRLMIPTLEAEKKLFSEAIIGQEDAVASFANILVNLRSGMKPQKPGPLDVLFLAGPSGVGKTEITLRLAKVLSEGETDAEKKVLKINGGEYQQDHYIARLFGSPPGYVGSKGTGSEVPPVLSQENLKHHRIKFTDKKGQEKGVTIILVDEVEKAHDAVHRAFLSVLDKGSLQIADNSETNFTNTVIIFTSNVGNQEIEKLLKHKNPIDLDDEAKKNLVTEAIGDKYPPELRGRIGKFIIFNHLTAEAVFKIANKQVSDVENTFKENHINLSLKISPEALMYLSRAGHSSSEGARAMGKVVKERIYEPLVLINNGSSLNGRRVFVDVENENLIFYHDTTLDKTTHPEKPKTEPIQKKSEMALEPIDPSIIERITKDIVKINEFYPVWGLEKVCDQINECVKAGIADREQIVSHTILKNRVQKLLAKMLEDDYNSKKRDDYGRTVKFYVQDKFSLAVQVAIRAAMFPDQLGAATSPEVLEKAKELLTKELDDGGIHGFNWLRGRFVKLNIGDDDYWNTEFKEVATKAFLSK